MKLELMAKDDAGRNIVLDVTHKVIAHKDSTMWLEGMAGQFSLCNDHSEFLGTYEECQKIKELYSDDIIEIIELEPEQEVYVLILDIGKITFTEVLNTYENQAESEEACNKLNNDMKSIINAKKWGEGGKEELMQIRLLQGVTDFTLKPCYEYFKVYVMKSKFIKSKKE